MTTDTRPQHTRLRVARKLAGLSVGQATFLTACNIAALEAGTQVPTHVEIEILSDTYDVRAAYLAAGELAPLSNNTVSRIAGITADDAAKLIFLLQVVKP